MLNMAKKRKKSSRSRAPRLGQHFLTGTWAAKKLVEAADIRATDTVLEIGPGRGALTQELLAAGARVIAVEKDLALVEMLKETLAKEILSGQLQLIQDDIRNFDPRSCQLEARSYVVAANIPYYITGEIIRQFLTARAQPHTVALLVQKEVAERIIARDKKESILSLSVKCYGEPSIAAKVSRGNFSPPPSVDSAILVIKNISREFFTDTDEKKFFDIVRAGFSSKRKFLIGNIAKKFGRERAESAFAAFRLPENARAEDVLLQKWKCLVQSLD